VPVAEGDGRVAPTLASPIRLGGGTAPDLGPPPRLGAHSRVLAREAGYREDEVDALVAAGVLR
jgi:crotonobetainyl-CoA:carnitine CoA-transferase CaiB-like acyl-CoA transferase